MNKFRATILIVPTLIIAGCSKRSPGPGTPASAQVQEQNAAEQKADEMLRQQAIDEANRENEAWQAIPPEERAQIEKRRKAMERQQNEGKKDKLP